MFWLSDSLCRTCTFSEDINIVQFGQFSLDEQFFLAAGDTWDRRSLQGCWRYFLEAGLIWTPRGLKLSPSPCQVWYWKGNQRASWEPTEQWSQRGQQVTPQCSWATCWQSDKTKTTNKSIFTGIFPAVTHTYTHTNTQTWTHTFIILKNDSPCCKPNKLI